MERFSKSKHLSEDFLMGHWHQAGRGSLSGLEVQFIQRCCLHCLPLCGFSFENCNPGLLVEWERQVMSEVERRMWLHGSSSFLQEMWCFRTHHYTSVTF
ncbi:hypothetical protein BaRGS_00017749 [Batillaria attramentaria]|uniref:Uncharacterized protein n=1 Tax=Batillaria attramentaria TaxID=370345 RepID=A0ABD0KVB7_9CAEN